MVKYILLICIFLTGIQGYSIDDKGSARVGLRKLKVKNISAFDTAGSKMNILDDYPNPTFTIQPGAMWLNNNAELSLNSERFGRGTTINLKNDFGINPGAVAPTGVLYIRLGKRHQIVGSVFGYSRSKSKSLERDIQYGDTTFYANASVKVKTHFIAYDLDYRFSILRSSRGELGLSIGAKLYDVFGGIEANIGQNQVAYSERKRIYAPALLPGVHGSFYITKKLLVRGLFEYFRLSVSDWDFKVYEFKPSIDYYILNNVGLGIGYSYFNISASKFPSDLLDGQLKYIINSTTLYATFRF